MKSNTRRLALAAVVCFLLPACVYAQQRVVGRVEERRPKELKFQVVDGPIQFLAYWVENAFRIEGEEEKQQSGHLRAYTGVRLDGQQQAIRKVDEELRSLDLILEGSIFNGGELTALLLDENGQEIFLRPGEGLVIMQQRIGDTASGISCEQCANLAVTICGSGKVKSVKCGADGSCSFECFDKAL